MRSLERFAPVVSLLVIAALLSGCSTFVAISTPGPTPDHLIKIGMPRSDVEDILDFAVSERAELDATVRVQYVYFDGPHKAFRTRAILWLATGVYTVFLSELFLWPMELSVRDYARRATDAVYDARNRLVYLSVVETADGTEVLSLGQRPGASADDKEALGQGALDHVGTGRDRFVPGGEFFSGCNAIVDDDCFQNEKPGEVRSVAAFRIDVTEVTKGDFQACVVAGACVEPGVARACNWGLAGHERHPINCIDWNQAAAYCEWTESRLPTEWEWEKAARGAGGRKFPWGEKAANCDYALIEYEEKSACGHGDTTFEVGRMIGGRSPYGLLDMAGNVWEWTSSTLGDDDGFRVTRGGSWFDAAEFARASYRGSYARDLAISNIGFRCARSAVADSMMSAAMPQAVRAPVDR